MQGKRRSPYAFVTFLMLNDSFLPGALMLAHGLRQQNTGADLVCLITEAITAGARRALAALFDQVVEVETIFVPHGHRQQRQDRPYLFTRLNALRLGPDGDLGHAYEKIVVLDADVLPLREYERLFTLEPPAGILNECKAHFVESAADGSYVAPPDVLDSGQWRWHQVYGAICPHGHRIPAEITDRVRRDAANLGVNGCLLVLEPSMAEYTNLRQALCQPEVRRLVGEFFDWPDMQYLTLRWSGQWTNVDLRFAGLNGYPCLPVLYGTHFAGVKPWSFGRRQTLIRYARYQDYQFWFQEYITMVTRSHPELRSVSRLEGLLQQIVELVQPPVSGFGTLGQAERMPIEGSRRHPGNQAHRRRKRRVSRSYRSRK